MRVLVTTPMHSDFHWGGLGYSCARITNGLHRRGHDVLVLVFDPGYQPQQMPPGVAETNEASAEIIYVPYGETMTGVRDPRSDGLSQELQQAYMRLQLVFDDFAPDVALAYFPIPIGYSLSLVAAERRVPLALAFRGNDLGRFAHDPLRMPLLKHCLQRAARSTFLAADLRALAIALEPSAAASTVIHNGIPDRVLNREWTCVRDSDLVFGAVGVFKPKKGIEVFMRAAKTLKLPEDRVRLVGDFLKSTSTREECQYPLTGIVPHEAALDLLDTLDVFVAPSLTDGCPNAVLEAMAAGRAIVCTPVGGMRDLLKHNESAYILRDWTEHEMEKALRTFLEDPALAGRLGSAARSVARGLTVETEAGAWDAFLREVALASPRP